MCFDFLYKVCLTHFSFCEELSEILAKKYTDLRVKYLFSVSD